MKTFRVVLFLGLVSIVAGSVTLVGVTTSPAHAQQCPNGRCP
jgi:hypothetical protein